MSSNDFNIESYGKFQTVETHPSTPPLASRGLRFGGMWLEALLIMVTLFIGWMIWSLVVWGRGQTPAKQVLKMRIYDQKTNKPAEWGRMAIRQFVIPFVLFAAQMSLFLISGSFDYINYDTGSYPGIMIFIYFVFIVIELADALWITRPEHQRLTDVVAGTYVVKES